MRFITEIAGGQVQRAGKGEDVLVIRPVNESGTAHLLAVADGLSLSDGKEAARWVGAFLRSLSEADSSHSIYEALRRGLFKEGRRDAESETTITCGILTRCQASESRLRFDYFAVGDSPIWKVVTTPIGSKYPFQRLLIHGSPFPAETARVYGTVRLHRGDIYGTVTFGSVEIEQGEVLVVCTDGIPERDVFLPRTKDVRRALVGESGDLCRWMFQKAKYQDRGLVDVLTNYDRQGLFSDDATIIVARLRRASRRGSVSDLCQTAAAESNAEGVAVSSQELDSAEIPSEMSEASNERPSEPPLPIVAAGIPAAPFASGPGGVGEDDIRTGHESDVSSRLAASGATAVAPELVVPKEDTLSPDSREGLDGHRVPRTGPTETTAQPQDTVPGVETPSVGASVVLETDSVISSFTAPPNDIEAGTSANVVEGRSAGGEKDQAVDPKTDSAAPVAVPQLVSAVLSAEGDKEPGEAGVDAGVRTSGAAESEAPAEKKTPSSDGT